MHSMSLRPGRLVSRRRALAALAALGVCVAAAAAPSPASAALPYGPYTCKSGFVWRAAFSGDGVCVTPTNRDQITRENNESWMRTLSNGYCVSGYVWRETRPQDHVCVSNYPPPPGQLAPRDRERSNNSQAVFRLQDPTETPFGGVGSWGSGTDSFYAYNNASGGGMTPYGQVSFFYLYPSTTGLRGPYSMYSLTANGSGYVNGYIGAIGCDRAATYRATIVALDKGTGLVTKAGYSEGPRRCG